MVVEPDFHDGTLINWTMWVRLGKPSVRPRCAGGAEGDLEHRSSVLAAWRKARLSNGPGSKRLNSGLHKMTYGLGHLECSSGLLETSMPSCRCGTLVNRASVVRH